MLSQHFIIDDDLNILGQPQYKGSLERLAKINYSQYINEIEKEIITKINPEDFKTFRLLYLIAKCKDAKSNVKTIDAALLYHKYIEYISSLTDKINQPLEKKPDNKYATLIKDNSTPSGSLTFDKIQKLFDNRDQHQDDIVQYISERLDSDESLKDYLGLKLDGVIYTIINLTMDYRVASIKNIIASINQSTDAEIEVIQQHINNVINPNYLWHDIEYKKQYQVWSNYHIDRFNYQQDSTIRHNLEHNFMIGATFRIEDRSILGIASNIAKSSGDYTTKSLAQFYKESITPEIDKLLDKQSETIQETEHNNYNILSTSIASYANLDVYNSKLFLSGIALYALNNVMSPSQYFAHCFAGQMLATYNQNLGFYNAYLSFGGKFLNLNTSNQEFKTFKFNSSDFIYSIGFNYKLKKQNITFIPNIELSFIQNFHNSCLSKFKEFILYNTKLSTEALLEQYKRPQYHPGIFEPIKTQITAVVHLILNTNVNFKLNGSYSFANGYDRIAGSCAITCEL